MKLSVLTATYNRSNYLEKLYKSILKNIETSNIEAEWIIINDGSTDNTEKVIENLIFENRIEIKYLFQENSGKMEAINRGMEEVAGEMIVDCDSDDFFTDNAFRIIEQNASKLLENEKIYALCFLKQDLLGNISGKMFPKDYMESKMFDLYFKQDIKGEKILVIIGPEGGFEEKEVEKARTAGARVISLGKRILRAETAGMALMAVLMFKLEE